MYNTVLSPTDTVNVVSLLGSTLPTTTAGFDWALVARGISAVDPWLLGAAVLEEPGSDKVRLGRAEVMVLLLDNDRPIIEDRFEGELEGVMPLAPPLSVGVNERLGSPTLVPLAGLAPSRGIDLGFVWLRGEIIISSSTWAFRFPVVDLISLMQTNRPVEVSTSNRRRCLAGSIPRLIRVVTAVT